MEFQFAPDVQKRLKNLLVDLNFSHIKAKQVICLRSYGSQSRARARIWSFPRVWQLALHLSPYYIIEVLSEKFDNLNYDEQSKILIHELLHIPKTFSGALLPHRGRGNRVIDARTVEYLFKKYKSQFK